MHADITVLTLLLPCGVQATPRQQEQQPSCSVCKTLNTGHFCSLCAVTMAAYTSDIFFHFHCHGAKASEGLLLFVFVKVHSCLYANITA